MSGAVAGRENLNERNMRQPFKKILIFVKGFSIVKKGIVAAVKSDV